MIESLGHCSVGSHGFLHVIPELPVGLCSSVEYRPSPRWRGLW